MEGRPSSLRAVGHRSWSLRLDFGGSRHRVELDCEGRQAASRWVRENLAAVRVQ